MSSQMISGMKAIVAKQWLWRNNEDWNWIALNEPSRHVTCFNPNRHIQAVRSETVQNQTHDIIIATADTTDKDNLCL